MRARFLILPFATIFSTCAFLGFLSPVGQAYRCKPLGSPLEELRNADAVFVGKVKKVKEEARVRITEFEVNRYWKGPSARTIVARSDKSLYGYRFTIGEKYLVYAWTGEDGLRTSRCGRTKSIASATFDLKELGEGKAPE